MVLVPRTVFRWINPIHKNSFTISSKYESLAAILLKDEADAYLKGCVVSKAAKEGDAISCEILQKNKQTYSLCIADCSSYVNKSEVRFLNLELYPMQTYLLISSPVHAQMLAVQITTPSFTKEMETIQKVDILDVYSVYWRAEALKGNFQNVYEVTPEFIK